jgi:hypothetical protein
MDGRTPRPRVAVTPALQPLETVISIDRQSEDGRA